MRLTSSGGQPRRGRASTAPDPRSSDRSADRACRDHRVSTSSTGVGARPAWPLDRRGNVSAPYGAPRTSPSARRAGSRTPVPPCRPQPPPPRRGTPPDRQPVAQSPSRGSPSRSSSRPASSCAITSSTSATSKGSSADVISSRSNSLGSIAIARTTATRCCCPPERLSGYVVALSARPNLSSSSVARVSAAARPTPSSCRGASVMLSMTERCGNRLNAWKTRPISRRTSSASIRGSVMSRLVKPDRAVVDGLEEVDASQQRRLARTRRPDQAGDVVLSDCQIDALQHVVRAEVLAHLFELAAAPSDTALLAAYLPQRQPVGEAGRAAR